MSRVVNRREKTFHTDLGAMNVITEELEDFDVEDIVRMRATSQARIVQFINLGKNVDINSPQGARTIKSKYANNDVELEE